MKNEKIAKYYDEYTTRQVRKGINIRHYFLMNKIIKAGLKKTDKVLEIGCGVGPLTSLLLSCIKHGKLLATDISGKSIEIAKERLKSKKNVEFMITDMMDFSYPEKFDFIIMPDVLEHIPIEKHERLFGVLAEHMHDSSQILINIPHPRFIEYLQKHSPKVLQIVDQSVWTDILVNNARKNKLALKHYNSYSIHHVEHDYAFVVFEKEKNLTKVVEFTTLNIIRRKFLYRLFYLLNKY
ncbi:MAG: class I SAM-dependent methyltransferase [Bacteroidales bacterium]|nr:class I SAM-dependent methyltransferase [Bacteroidales bacterium]